MQVANPYLKNITNKAKRSASWLWRNIVDTISAMGGDGVITTKQFNYIYRKNIR